MGNCVRNDTLAKDAVNAVAEVYSDICKSLGHPASSTWRADYSAGKDQVCLPLLIFVIETSPVCIFE